MVLHADRGAEDYAIHCRRPATPGEDPPLDTGPAPDEEVLLDENRLAEGLEFLEVGNLAVSPDHRWLAYATDTTGGEIFALAFRRLAARQRRRAALRPVPGSRRRPRSCPTPTTAWPGPSDNATVFYTRVDDAMRPYQLWRHRLGTDPADDVLVLEEPDERFTLSVGSYQGPGLRGGGLQSNTTSEVWVVPARPAGGGAHAWW